MQGAQYWIDHLMLQRHPEGGYYKETYRSTEGISKKALPERFTGQRSFSTAIYFLLRSQDRSLFHRIKSDELWHFHTGSALSIYVLTKPGLEVHLLGDNPEKGESLQLVIPANSWFGAKLNDSDSYTLSSCTVAPGFDFADFEMADRASLLQEFPQYEEVIVLLTV